MIFKLTDNFGVKLKTPIFVGCVKYINPFVLDTGSNTVYTSVPSYRGAPKYDTKSYAIYFSENNVQYVVVCPD